jgi:hypothetical protein
MSLKGLPRFEAHLMLQWVADLCVLAKRLVLHIFWTVKGSIPYEGVTALTP